MTIQTIIKRAIKRLELEGNMLTPDAYTQAFCKEAKKAGMMIDDCNQVEGFSRTLNSDLQKELSNYNIKTLNEFIRFLISKLNRSNANVCLTKLDAQTELSKNILNVVSKLENKDASLLAKKSLALLKGNVSGVQELNHYKQLWRTFKVDDSNEFLKDIASLIVSSLKPSISTKEAPLIKNLSDKLLKEPESLKDVDIKEKIESAIALRITLDKENIQEVADDIDSLLDKLSIRLIDMISNSNNSNNEIKKIKGELDEYANNKDIDFSLTHKLNLSARSYARIKKVSRTIADLDNSDKIKAMAKKIEELEAELAKVKESSKEDFLTKLYNRRALDEQFNLKEAEFKRYNHNYSIAMFDLDHFKSINDTYGHDAGDIVLASFAKILKREAREVDIVGRFGGEEFIVILSETTSKGAEIFAQKVRQSVEKTKFMYKGTRISVTVSIGVSERANNINLEGLIKSADNALYEAKRSGRNRVVIK